MQAWRDDQEASQKSESELARILKVDPVVGYHICIYPTADRINPTNALHLLPAHASFSQLDAICKINPTKQNLTPKQTRLKIFGNKRLYIYISTEILQKIKNLLYCPVN
ncbi:hypothetical protein LguiA_010860 [Lonicera macranthoides]